MPSLSAREVLEVWENGETQHPIDRAITLLAAAAPEQSWDELTELSIGERDARLLALHERLFGPELLGFVECDRCGAALEMQLSVSDLYDPSDSGATQTERKLKSDGTELLFRLPTSRDLAAVAGVEDADSGRRLLARRCLLEMKQDGAAVALGELELPETILTQLADRMSECDPNTEILLEMDCPECGHQSQTLLDIGTFLWAELLALARRLLHEVRVLAQNYYWSESEILNMSATRRRAYLEALDL